MAGYGCRKNDTIFDSIRLCGLATAGCKDLVGRGGLATAGDRSVLTKDFGFMRACLVRPGLFHHCAAL